MAKTNNNWNIDFTGVGVQPQTKGNTVPWSEGRWFWLKRANLDRLRVRDGYESQWPWKYYPAKNLPRPTGTPPPAYAKPRGIDSALKKDLLTMLDRHTIPEAYREFIEAIPSDQIPPKPITSRKRKREFDIRLSFGGTKFTCCGTKVDFRGTKFEFYGTKYMTLKYF